MSGYAVFDPDKHSQKSHPEYGTCEALYPNLTEEEAMKKLERFEEANPDKQYVLLVWPSGERVGK